MVQNPLRIDTPYSLIIRSSSWPALENSAQKLYPAGGLAPIEVFVRRMIAVLGQTQRETKGSEVFVQQLRELRLPTPFLQVRALQAAKWIIGGPASAAAKLGMKRTTLQSKIQKLDLSRP